MLSILIPTFNDELRPIVEDLCRQIEPLESPIEIIIGDDHSHDQDAYNALEGHGPVTLMRNPKNLGRTATRHRLAQEANFEKLLFLDADVMPARADFLQRYLSSIHKAPVVFGGVSYTAEKPEKSMRLRWVYGKEREAKTAHRRQKNPHFIISQNLMIDRVVFLKVNNPEIKRYGWDNVFSFELMHRGIEVAHIDNPVIHLGLEPCKTYLDKVDQAMNTLVWAERRGMISKDFTSIQKFYNRLNSLNLAGLLRQFIRPCLPLMRRQLASDYPSVRMLDLYKFYYFSFYKNKA